MKHEIVYWVDLGQFFYIKLCFFTISKPFSWDDNDLRIVLSENHSTPELFNLFRVRHYYFDSLLIIIWKSM